MKMKKVLSFILAALTIATVCILPISADEIAIENYYTTEYTAEKDKVDTMTLVYSSKEYGYDMYLDPRSGEFAILNTKTGEYTFSNPYDVAANVTINSGAEKVRYSLLSQIMLKYTDTSTESSAYMSSYEHAAMMGDQISYTQLTDGIRVEYALGTVESKRLLPHWIEAERFETKILTPLQAAVSLMTDDEKFIFNNLTTSYYSYKDQTDERNESSVAGWRKTYPCLANNHEMKIYTIATDKNAIRKQVESLIRTYVPEYTYEELEYDHELTGYEGDEKEPALFRLAVEYRFDEHGFTASVPAKSIRYNETNYTLDSLTILPYFGCSSVKDVGTMTKNGGYAFIPDGSGTLLNFYLDDGSVNTGIQGIAMYGMDYGYEDLSATGANQETARMPVYGLVENYSRTVTTKRSGAPDKSETTPYSRGYLAIIENGTSFAYITACLGQTAWVNYASANCEYNTVYASFTVKQTDTVSLGSSLGNASEMTTSINTKYTGNYAIRFVLLSDPNLAKTNGFDSYEPSYVGMANAYRDYLERTGVITPLTAEEVKNGTPLYIQSFGALDTDDTFLSIPVVKRVALTTFDDIETMSSRLKEAGILNQNYILTAFANGTLEWQNYPSALRWEKVVGRRSGLKDLIRYADEEGINLFPNFDFANVMGAAGGFRFRRHASQTMSGRYVTKRTYDPVYQRMGQEGFSNLVSASAFQYLYEKFAQKYNKLNVGGLAVLTLGNDLNSDFNVDNALTREDSKEYTIDLLAKMAEDNDRLLVSGGNAYVLPYVTDMIDVSMYNSRFEISSASVPFVGMVLHGFVNFAGTPVNMAGDLMYEILKSIESGSALYFILSYQNTNKLKEGTELASEYYSVNFDTWYPDVVKYYNIVNDAIGGLQNAMITDHKAMTAFRLTSEDAYTLFRQLEDSEKTYQSTKKAYYDSIAESDRIIADQRDSLAALAAETANRIAFENATKRYELVKGMIATSSVSDVVSVTYTAADGKDTVFYINYNSFDVAIYVDGRVCRLAPNSFTTKDKLTGESFVLSDAETVTAWLPTTKGIANYRTMQENMNAALESGSTAKINRAQTNLANTVSVMATNTSDVVSLTAADGSQFFINYTQSIVLVRISDTRYEIISPRSYLKID